MKEIEFLQKYKAIEKMDNEQAENVLKELIEQQEKGKVKTYLEKCAKILPRKTHEKTADEIVMDNFVTILSKFDYCYFVKTIVPELLTREALQDFLKDCFPVFLENIKYFIDRGESHFKKSQYTVSDFVEAFINATADDEKFISNNIENIIINTPNEQIFKVTNLLKGRSDIIDDKLNNILEKNKMKIVNAVIEKGFVNKRSEIDITPEFIEKIIKEIGGASFSHVFRIEDKIFKIGTPRITYKIPYSKRLLRPLVRTNLYEGKDVVGYIEIEERIDMDFHDADIDILYELWKEQREAGIFWADPHPGNIGRLLKDNVPLFNGEKTYVSDQAIGFMKDNEQLEEEPLKTGDYVFPDLDLFYKISDLAQNQQIATTKLAELFEKQYLSEKEAEKIKKQIKEQEEINQIER